MTNHGGYIPERRTQWRTRKLFEQITIFATEQGVELDPDALREFITRREVQGLVE